MKQNKNIKGKSLMFETIYDDGKKIWFAEFNFNALFKMDKTNKNVQFVGSFPNEKFTQKRLYISMDEWNKKIYFAPYTAEEIAVYDLAQKEFQKLKVLLPNKFRSSEWEKPKFHRVIAVNGKVYFIPFHYPGILVYDINANSFTCFDDWIDEIENNRKTDWGYFLEFVLENDRLILPCACADAVVIFDISTQRSRVILTPWINMNNQCRYCGISYINNYFYLLTGDGRLIRRKLISDSEEIKTIKLPVSGEMVAEFYPMKYRNNYLYLFPFNKNKGLKMNILSEQLESEQFFDDEQDNKGNNRLYLVSFISDEKLYAMTGNSEYFIEYNFKNKIKQKYKLYLVEQDYYLIRNMQREVLSKEIYENLILEDSIYSLNLMLEVLIMYTNLESKNAILSRSKDVIYNKLKELLIHG